MLTLRARVAPHGDGHVGKGHLELADADGRPRVARLKHRHQVAQLPQRALLRARRPHDETEVERPLEQALQEGPGGG